MTNPTQELREALGKINAFTGVMQSIDARMSEGQKLHLADAVDGVMRLYEHLEALSTPKPPAGTELRERAAAVEALILEVEKWCVAITQDSSWDGWDSHYKRVKFDLLPKAQSSAWQITLNSKA